MFGSAPRVMAAVAAVALAGFSNPAPAAAVSDVPDLSGFWQHSIAQEEWENPPDGGSGPVRNIVGRPHWEGDATNPILKPWAAERVKHNADVFRDGHQENTAQELCMPSGVPNVMTLLAPVQLLQTRDTVALLYARDHMVRLVHMNAAHPAKLAPSWYGDSVGHYEGDTLVVDTVGLNDKSWTDRYGTPHTEAMHVVERFTLANGGKTLRVLFTVDDPNAFTTPWTGMLNYARAPANYGVIEEEVCAENNRFLKTPSADRADF